MTTSKILLIAICGFLSGCSSYNSKFDCKPGQGLGCMSISNVNKIVEEGSLESHIDLVNGNKRKEKGKFNREKINIWVAPSYEDGVFFEEKRVSI